MWIAFDLYLWNIEHNRFWNWKILTLVVNCFRFVSLKYWTQLEDAAGAKDRGCELLSICIFEILNTTYLQELISWGVLWIAFDLYLWNIEHNWNNTATRVNPVVNCFRFVSLKYWTQPRYWLPIIAWRCELLSICIFEILNTTCFV